MNRLLFAVAVLGLTACSENRPPSSGESSPDLPDSVVRQAQLLAYPTCVDLDRSVKARLIAVMQANLAASFKSALLYSRSGYYGWSGQDAGSGGTSGGAGGGSAGGSGGGPADVTTTNVQVVGVDEPDLIKNDGNRIFVLSKGKLFASRSWPAADLAVAGSIAIAGTPAEMFLDGDRVIVFSNSWARQEAATLATVIDVSALSAMKVIGQYDVPGYYRSARRIGKSVRMVTNRYFSWPLGVSPYFSYWGRQWNGEAELYAEFTRLWADNERKINAATLEQLLPSAFWRGATNVSFSVDCASVHLSTGLAALGYSEVATFQTDVDAELNRQVLFEAADEVYADDDSLYFTSRHWWWNSPAGSTDATYIHKFDTSAPGSARYFGTGVVDGHLVDQFAMDEWNGNLRVAATVRSSAASSWSQWSEVSVLAPSNGRLVQLGKSARLAEGEQITSARFIGDVGYVVTFRQTDPLFVFDLKDPTHPKKIGELKVPGFSSYIHPLDATHLLTIGTYQPESGGWQERAVQLAIFDVSDLTAPKQTHLQLLGSYSASSEAQQNHKAFNYFPAKKLLAVPFYQWTWGRVGSSGYSYWYELESDLRVFEVDPVQGFTSRGTLSLSDLGTRSSYYASDAIVRRSVLADDFVYAISEAGIRVAKVDALDAPLATAKF